MGVAVLGGIVPFEEIAGSPRYAIGRESHESVRVGRTAWLNNDALWLECFGIAPSLPGIHPGVNHLYADTLEIEPFHPEPGDEMVCLGDQPARYTYARATIKYSKLPYEAATLITRRYSFSGEFLTIPSAALKWEDTGLKPQNEESTAAKRILMIEHSITWHRVQNSAIPWAAIKANVGKVNNGTLNNAYFTNVEDETLLYLGAEMNFTFSTDGSQVWTLEHRFQERQVKVGSDTFGWNHFLRTEDDGTTKWARLIDEDDNPVYPKSSTFTSLFT